MKKTIIFVSIFIYLALLIFTRFYNLENTARFSEDESGFLVRSHQIFQERKITLAGQVNEEGTKLFSSLTVYLLLPFAIIGKFDPLSIFYGAAVWGILTVIVMLYLTNKINRLLLWLTAPLLLLWFPLLQTGRWAWNPNFIPFWVSLGLLCYLKQTKISLFLMGIFFGLAVHQHYYALFAVSFFILLTIIDSLVKKNYFQSLPTILGFIIALSPFIVFDLRHPPGIFILGAVNQSQNIISQNIVSNLLTYTPQLLKYHTQSIVLSSIFAISVIILFLHDLSKKNRVLLYFLPCVFQILIICKVASYFFHYFIVIIPFLFVWLIYPRQKYGKFAQHLAVLTLITGGLISVVPQLTISPVIPNLSTLKKIDTVLKIQITNNPPVKTNIAVLASEDRNAQGKKYRDLLLIPANVQILSRDEYPITKNLFVISTSTEDIVRNDASFQIDNFRTVNPVNTWYIESTPWRIYHFSKK